MRDVADYFKKVAEFDELARGAADPALKKRYADLAECYRLLANEMTRRVETGGSEPEPV